MGIIDRESAGQLLIPLAITATLALAVASALAARTLVLQLPTDFLEPRWVPLSRTRAVLRSVAGAALIGAGVALLVLPGPGLVLIALGALMLRPGWRAKIVRWIAGKPAVIRQINVVRRRHGCPELDPPVSERG